MPEASLTLDEFAGIDRVEETPVPVCDVCGATESDATAVGYDFELRTCSNRWVYVTCAQCSHVWLHPRPAIEALDIIYPTTYYAYNYEQISSLARKAKEIIDTRKLKRILASVGSTPRRYLDVGCGDGRYLDSMVRHGVPQSEVCGLELDEAIVDRVRERGYDQVHCARVEDFEGFEPGSFDLITMFHVIEHVASPREVVEKLASLLAPGGVLALETPNIDSLDARLFADGLWGGYHIPRHWHLFRPATMTRLLDSVGLQVEATRFETGHSFWMYSFHHRLRYGSRPHKRLSKLFDPMGNVVQLAAFTGFDRVRSMLGARTSAMLLLARRSA